MLARVAAASPSGSADDQGGAGALRCWGAGAGPMIHRWDDVTRPRAPHDDDDDDDDDDEGGGAAMLWGHTRDVHALALVERGCGRVGGGEGDDDHRGRGKQAGTHGAGGGNAAPLAGPSNDVALKDWLP